MIPISKELCSGVGAHCKVRSLLLCQQSMRSLSTSRRQRDLCRGLLGDSRWSLGPEYQSRPSYQLDDLDKVRFLPLNLSFLICKMGK